MTGTLRRLVALTGVPKAGLAVSVGLGALVVLFGVGLMTSAGYLISRAAEHPPILSLTVTIVAVRFFGLARPAARYLERLASHDVALRSLGQVRARFYRRLEPLAPGEVSGYRSGDLLARMVGDVDALQGLYLRGLAPPLVALAAASACVGVATAILPLAGLVLGLGLLTAGVCVPALAALQGRHSGLRQAAARGELTAELVELQRGAPELVVYGREEDALARVRRADAELARLGRRDALTPGSRTGSRSSSRAQPSRACSRPWLPLRSTASSSRRSRSSSSRRSRRSRRSPAPPASWPGSRPPAAACSR